VSLRPPQVPHRLPSDQTLGLHSEKKATNQLSHDMASKSTAATGHKPFKAFFIFMVAELSIFSLNDLCYGQQTFMT
jgi:hypothetical protein